MRPRTISRFIGNLLGIRRRRLANIRRYRRWCELCRKEGRLAELAAASYGDTRHPWVVAALQRHRLEMSLFLEAVS